MSGFIQPMLTNNDEPFDSTSYPIVDFDAADYQTGPTTGALPANGSICKGTGGYSLTVVNPTSIAYPTPQITWQLTTSPFTGAQNPVFQMNSNITWPDPTPPVNQIVDAWISINDVNFGITIPGKPYGVSPYSVFMAYRTGRNGDNLLKHNQGRLLNTNANPNTPMVQPVTGILSNQAAVYRDWWAGTWWDGVPTLTGNYQQRINAIFPAVNVTLGSSDNGKWQFLWITYSGAYNTYGGFTMYGFYADNDYGFQTVVGNNGIPPPWPFWNTKGYINSPYGLRLWSRYLDATRGSWVQDAQIGFIKVYDKALSLNEMEQQYNTYKNRFGMTRPFVTPDIPPYSAGYGYI
jgi:hypothetical protein